ncbi:ATP-binding protein [Microvirga mediterraneensis]|uniref:ATP-binding protein n=1 Tax=Microvirga mediterraneensis TaxID=2754695 RepID=A0A838BNC5_9HYPH|nr:ATP-binding protein [Microvirga mediterraneensis]MBA1157037.1 ATP-binding protein [Microvirga mediterraneensis]
MSLRLPSRYEDLDLPFRGRLKPNQSLLEVVKRAFSSMEISGGIRFLPIFGISGSGKTSAALEIGTHLPDLYVEQLPRDIIEKPETLTAAVKGIQQRAKGRKTIVVIDQYEEVAAQRTAIPTNFVEALSLMDRGDLRDAGVLFIWLTTSREFQKSLSDATTRNRRILSASDFVMEGLPSKDWPEVIQETFQFHNQERTLSDYEILENDLLDISDQQPTIGAAIEETGNRLQKYTTSLHDLSTYQVVMLWPVTDGLRITRIQQFTDPRQGYKLDWNAWFRQLNSDDQKQLPLREYNRARLYFDIRLIPIAAADLHPLCKDLDKENFKLSKSYLERLENTHFYSIIKGNWNPDNYAPLRERESKRADEARDWYSTVTTDPTKLGNRIARCLRELGVSAAYEQTVGSPHGRVRADVLIERSPMTPPNVIVEIKAFSPENTMPSTICQAVQTTLRRHAQFAGFLQRQ